MNSDSGLFQFSSLYLGRLHIHTYDTRTQSHMHAYPITYIVTIHRFVSHRIIITTKHMGLDIHHQDSIQAPFLPTSPNFTSKFTIIHAKELTQLISFSIAPKYDNIV